MDIKATAVAAAVNNCNYTKNHPKYLHIHFSSHQREKEKREKEKDRPTNWQTNG